jgi:hypothetical protein
MLRAQPARGDSTSRDAFVLYVEGPGDRSILREWSYRLLPREATRLAGATVILGGRQPARAVEHFESESRRRPGLRALCILDRDDHEGRAPEHPGNLEFFTWSRRHIESYLLVPAAIRRTLRLADNDPRIHLALDEVLPRAAGESVYRQIDAKRLLGRNGALPRALGRAISLPHVARATRSEELHPDVHRLFGQLRDRLGVREPLR